MTTKSNLIVITTFMLLSCNSSNLKTIVNVDNDLQELSAVETLTNSNLFWSVEDSGNANLIYGINTKGSIEKKIMITNVENRDWEDLTTDTISNLYIGEFGNNSKTHERFYIYKISNISNSETKAEIITFKLPNHIKSKNFEAFFLWKNYFYLFSKEPQKTTLLKVPNSIGTHTAQFITTYTTTDRGFRITSSDISEDGKKIALLCRNKVILLSNYQTENFFEGTVNVLDFNHDSQKEGVCFKNDSTLIINDEYNHLKGGNIYEYSLF